MLSLKHPAQPSTARVLHHLKSLVRSPLAAAAVVALLAIFAFYVHVLHEVVLHGEQTRQAWRATALEQAMERSKTPHLRAEPKRLP